MAELALMVVFPSSCSALVTNKTLGGADEDESNIEVRSARYDSAAWERGSEHVTKARRMLKGRSQSRQEETPFFDHLLSARDRFPKPGEKKQR